MKERRGFGVIVIVVLLLVAVITYFLFNCIFSPYWDSIYPPMGYLSLVSYNEIEDDMAVLAAEDAKSDIDYLIATLKRVHPLCKDGVPSEISELAESEKAQFSDNSSVYDVWRSYAKIIHKLDDSQTVVFPAMKLSYLMEHRKLIDDGCTLVSVNNIPISDILDNNREILSYETDEFAMITLMGLLDTKEGLKLLGLYDNGAVYLYSDKSGNEIVRHYTPDDFYYYIDDETETNDVPYRSTIYNEKAAGLTFDSLEYGDEFKKFLYDFFIDIGDRGIDNLIIDLRECQSGTSQVLDEILMYTNFETFKTPGGFWRLGSYTMNWESEDTKIIKMDVDIMFDGDIYVLTSGKTYGSATLMTEIIQDNGFGKVIGKPCGNRPDGYGEVVLFQAPKSGLLFQVSSKKFYRIDETKSGSLLVPDVDVESEKALDKALEIINN